MFSKLHHRRKDVHHCINKKTVNEERQTLISTKPKLRCSIKTKTSQKHETSILTARHGYLHFKIHKKLSNLSYSEHL